MMIFNSSTPFMIPTHCQIDSTALEWAAEKMQVLYVILITMLFL